MATILAVDKDPLQLDLLSHLLQGQGHKVHATPEPEQALELLQSQLIDLVILETTLPRHDGMRVCQQMRQLNPYTPLMILSERTDEDQIVRGLTAAADAYVIKSISPRQLLAQVAALLRRGNLTRSGRWGDDNLSIGEITLNLARGLALVNGVRVSLTKAELSLLHALMENAGRVLSREQLMEMAWGDGYARLPKMVDVYIRQLRIKIQPHLRGGDYLQSLRGFGYKFELPRPQSAFVH
ncbi:MAG: response regulator transcription factor [Candidatus Dormibacteraeota bacterium]|nr:response regulator transcription factor [Candidatus Dormibacteraeota bacterium]